LIFNSITTSEIIKISQAFTPVIAVGLQGGSSIAILAVPSFMLTLLEILDFHNFKIMKGAILNYLEWDVLLIKVSENMILYHMVL
jgi:hypothetical protein